MSRDKDKGRVQRYGWARYLPRLELGLGHWPCEQRFMNCTWPIIPTTLPPYGAHSLTIRLD